MILIHIEYQWGLYTCGNLAFHRGLIVKVVILAGWIFGYVVVSTIVVLTGRWFIQLFIQSNQKGSNNDLCRSKDLFHGILTLPH